MGFPPYYKFHRYASYFNANDEGFIDYHCNIDRVGISLLLPDRR